MAQEQIDLDKKLLERGYWIATHRLALERWASRGLYAVIILAYLIFFIQFALYMYRLNEWQGIVAQSMASTVDWKKVHEDLAPLDIEFGTPAVFFSGEQRYDLVVEVYNPNKQWAIESMNVQFAYGDSETTESQQVFVLPGERKYITALGIGSDTPIAGISTVTSTDYHWKKVSHLPPLNWNFIEPPTYLPKETIVDKGVQKVLPATVTWTVENDSTLNIRTVIWQVSFITDGKLSAIAEYRRENFPFLQKRDFSFSVSDYVGRVDRVKVYPIVNIFDPNFSYLPQS